MAIGACDDCKRYYLFEEEVVEQRQCPHCGKPLRMTTVDEALDAYRMEPHPQEGKGRPPSRPEEGQARMLEA
jgi:PHP family Zn ribbon phosphoesterase